MGTVNFSGKGQATEPNTCEVWSNSVECHIFQIFEDNQVLFVASTGNDRNGLNSIHKI